MLCPLCERAGFVPGREPTLWRCSGCGFLLNRRGDEESRYGGEPPPDPRRAAQQWQWFAGICARSDTPTARLFDVGCGSGGFVQLARQHGWEADGVDLNPGQGPGRAGSFPGCGLPGGLAAVTFWDVLDHLTEPVAALRAACGALVPGGIVVVRVRNAPVHLGVRAWQRRLGRVPTLGVVHACGFSAATLRAALARGGFRESELLAHRYTRGLAYPGYERWGCLFELLKLLRLPSSSLLAWARR